MDDTGAEVRIDAECQFNSWYNNYACNSTFCTDLGNYLSTNCYTQVAGCQYDIQTNNGLGGLYADHDLYYQSSPGNYAFLQLGSSTMGPQALQILVEGSGNGAWIQAETGITFTSLSCSSETPNLSETISSFFFSVFSPGRYSLPLTIISPGITNFLSVIF